MNLMEQYKQRIAIAESVHTKTHSGEPMSNMKKIMLAKVLDNTSKFLGEAFNSSNATQRSDLGAWKKFCLNLVNVAIPNLIAPDLVMVSPMSSLSGYITYIKYTAGTTKGATTQGDLFNSPFKLGNVDPNYTGNNVVEALAVGTGNVLAWTPTIKGQFTVSGTTYDAKVTAAAGTATYVYIGTDNKLYTDSALSSLYTGVSGDKVAYYYDNEIIPQNNLPTLNASLESIAVLAHARRIAVYYSQIAAFQSKTDYGFDLGDQLAEKAVGQLSYEIDTEIVDMLVKASTAPSDSSTIWSKTLPVGVNFQIAA